MQSYKLAVGAVLACTMLSGCVSMVSITPKPADSQNLRYYSGAGLMTSNGTDCSVVFGPLEEIQEIKNYSFFYVGITNRSQEPVLFRPQEFVASAPTGWGGKASPLEVKDKNAHITQLEQERASAQFAAAVVAFSSAVQAAAPSTSYSTSNVYSSSGSRSTVNTVTTSSNPALSSLAQQQGLANSMAISRQAEDRYAQGMSARGEFIATNTIMPGDTYRAVVGVLPPQGGLPITATYDMAVCTEQHTFKVGYSKASGGGGSNRAASAAAISTR